MSAEDTGDRSDASASEAAEPAKPKGKRGGRSRDASASEAAEPATSTAVSTPLAAPPEQPKPMRKGLIRVRALRSVAVGGMPYETGDVFVCNEEAAKRRLDRGELERVS